MSSTKVLALLSQNQPDEAERFAKGAMAEARAGDRTIKETELLMLLLFGWLRLRSQWQQEYAPMQ